MSSLGVQAARAIRSRERPSARTLRTRIAPITKNIMQRRSITRPSPAERRLRALEAPGRRRRATSVHHRVVAMVGTSGKAGWYRLTRVPRWGRTRRLPPLCSGGSTLLLRFASWTYYINHLVTGCYRLTRVLRRGEAWRPPA
jgi:hypothetical protein